MNKIISFDELEHYKPSFEELWQRIERLEEQVDDLTREVRLLHAAANR